MVKQSKKASSKTKTIQIYLPVDLYRRFKQSRVYRESASENEAVRACIKQVIDQKQDCQENYPN